MIKEQFESLIYRLSLYFQDSTNEDKIELFIEKAKNENAWFSDSLIREAMKAIESQFLDVAIWISFFDKYGLPKDSKAKVGLILSGNLPAVGMHDLLMVIASGNQAIVKLSSQDSALMLLYIDAIRSIDASVSIDVVDRLSKVDAVIATGSDFSSSYFSNYFAKIPHIIRKNRSSVAVFTGSESVSDFEGLARDIFTYYGLGCRNVSSLAIPLDFDLIPLFDVLTQVDWVLDHTKYTIIH
jgi:hypothetical protein